jgi:hypothetical protein
VVAKEPLKTSEYEAENHEQAADDLQCDPHIVEHLKTSFRRRPRALPDAGIGADRGGLERAVRVDALGPGDARLW